MTMRTGGGEGDGDAASASGSPVDPEEALHALQEQSRAYGQLRAQEYASTARFWLGRILAHEDSGECAPAGESGLAALFRPEDQDGATPVVAGQRERTLQAFPATLLPFAELTAVAGALSSTVPLVRKQAAQALVVLLGMPALLGAVAQGRRPVDRLELILPKVRRLSLAQLHVVDEAIAGLDERLSLGRHLAVVTQVVAGLELAEANSAQARRTRHVRLEKLEGAEGCLSFYGPYLELAAFHARGQAVARAVLRNQMGALTLAPARPSDAAGGQAGGNGGCGGSAAPVDPRNTDQLVFDLLTGALPQTATVLEDTTSGGVPGRRKRVAVTCPSAGSWLRKQAGVNVTVPVTTLLRVDDRPGLVAGSTPLPADVAREVAGHATVWNRILTDPATGVVLDEAARMYLPDRGTRSVVNTKWQLCTAPGCSVPAQACEFEHGVPFDHADPSSGGPTHPVNGHPMCRKHHGLKTRGVLRMRRVSGDEIVWELPLGVQASTVAAPVDAGPAVPGDAGAAPAGEDPSALAAGEYELWRDAVVSGEDSARIAVDATEQLVREHVREEERRWQTRAAVAAAEARRRAEMSAQERDLAAREEALREARRVLRAAQARAAAEEERLERLRRECEDERSVWEFCRQRHREREARIRRIEDAWWQSLRTHVFTHPAPDRAFSAPVVKGAADGGGAVAPSPEEDQPLSEAEERQMAGTLAAHRDDPGFAEFLLRHEALGQEDYWEHVGEETVQEAESREGEEALARDEARRRAEREDWRRRQAAAQEAWEREYQREARRWGRRRARAEHADLLREACPAECCVEARTAVEGVFSAGAEGADGAEGAGADTAEGSTVPLSAEEAQAELQRERWSRWRGVPAGANFADDTPPPF
ncbi:hypothetical protein [Brevibacterium sp.]|uniref:hypothetical protein n=1 Tax=Brevibacterium sp. TaxID=1701 RepID=UPI0025C195F4|nr:hypothetical protein [Brevibacterium sp.]